MDILLARHNFVKLRMLSGHIENSEKNVTRIDPLSRYARDGPQINSTGPRQGGRATVIAGEGGGRCDHECPSY